MVKGACLQGAFLAHNAMNPNVQVSPISVFLMYKRADTARAACQRSPWDLRGGAGWFAVSAFINKFAIRFTCAALAVMVLWPSG